MSKCFLPSKIDDAFLEGDGVEEVAELCIKSGMEAYTAVPVLGAIKDCVYELYREMRRKEQIHMYN